MFSESDINMKSEIWNKCFKATAQEKYFDSLDPDRPQALYGRNKRGTRQSRGKIQWSDTL